ncbi:hypothetical protein QBC37DRAFT_174436 [Rhypophila decipiens]|uniref:Clr5 domain-containing protein n=1 Tax=Rhypophila decipiens TaxID=261697 RepID=A0AAN6Y6D0_9PEZI|nr:hypothetical protein QBC37DRAFT_174436 [Rhypophila decipiens]
MADGKISKHVNNCLSVFGHLLLLDAPTNSYDTPNKEVVDSLREEEARFKVWAGNIGAHKAGRSSLDYRLRDASHIQEQVIELITDLTGLIEGARAIITGEKIPWDKLDDGDSSSIDDASDSVEDDFPKTELDQIVMDAADVINCLLRLSVAIRNPAPHDRFAASVPAIDTDHYEPFGVQHVQGKFGQADQWLAARLGRAISRRRQYFKYRERHHQKLSEGLALDHGADHGLSSHVTRDGVSTIASSIPEEVKGAPFDRLPLSTVDEDALSDSGVSQTSFASSNAESEKLRVPPIPEEAHKGPFECPFCFRMITASSTISWRRHVFGDLRPYICLWEGCDDPIISLSVRPARPEDGIQCPLCQEALTSFKLYQRHVGRHQEQLALFALPPLDSTSEGDGEADSEADHSGQSDAGSSSEEYDETKAKVQKARARAEMDRLRSEYEELERRIYSDEEPKDVRQFNLPMREEERWLRQYLEETELQRAKEELDYMRREGQGATGGLDRREYERPLTSSDRQVLADLEQLRRFPVRGWWKSAKEYVEKGRANEARIRRNVEELQRLEKELRETEEMRRLEDELDHQKEIEEANPEKKLDPEVEAMKRQLQQYKIESQKKAKEKKQREELQRLERLEEYRRLEEELDRLEEANIEKKLDPEVEALKRHLEKVKLEEQKKAEEENQRRLEVQRRLEEELDHLKRIEEANVEKKLDSEDEVEAMKRELQQFKMEQQKKSEEEELRRAKEKLGHQEIYDGWVLQKAKEELRRLQERNERSLQEQISLAKIQEALKEVESRTENNDKPGTDTQLSAGPHVPLTCEMPGCNRRRCKLDDPNDPKESQWCREHVCSATGCSRVRVSSLDATGTVPFQYFETECDQHFVHPAAAKWERLSAMRDETSRASPSPNPGGDRKGKGKETGHLSSEGPGGDLNDPQRPVGLNDATEESRTEGSARDPQEGASPTETLESRPDDAIRDVIFIDTSPSSLPEDVSRHDADPPKDTSISPTTGKRAAPELGADLDPDPFMFREGADWLPKTTGASTKGLFSDTQPSKGKGKEPTSREPPALLSNIVEMGNFTSAYRFVDGAVAVAPVSPKRIPDEKWESYKDIIAEKYMTCTLEEVGQYMAEHYNFHATKRQYIHRVKEKWGITKY